MERKPYHPTNEIGKFEAAMLRLQVFALRSRCEPEFAQFKTTHSLYNKERVDLLVVRNDYLITEEILFTHENGNTIRRRNEFHFGTDYIEREQDFETIERDSNRNLVRKPQLGKLTPEQIQEKLTLAKARITNPSLNKIIYKHAFWLSHLLDSIQPEDYVALPSAFIT